MSFDINAAKKAGYTDQEIQSFLGKQPAFKNFDAESAKKAGYSEQEIDSFLNKNDVSKTRSVLSAPLKGAIKGAEELSSLADPTQMILNQILPQKQSLLNKVTERVLPTRKEGTEQFLERAGKLLPTAALGGSGVLISLLQSAAGAGAGELAKEEGFGETGQGIAEAIGMGIPGLTQALGKKAVSLIKSPVEKLTSGLTKPRALGAKFSEKGIISPARQEQTIANLNKEASKLAETTLHKEVPLVEQIQKGFDFESQFEKRFSDLQKMAEKANPEIDITPISKFMSETAKKYRGIPKLHPEAEKISSEIRAFQKRPQFELEKLLRIYRSNNKKIKGIYETSRLTGKQQEYVDFLVDLNRNIAKSFEDTLPKDSAWVKEFKDANQYFKQYKDAQKSLHLLEPILEQKATPASIQKFASDARMQKKLELAMGKQGSDEIIQIAKDLTSATDAIKNIPVKELNAWDAIIPFSLFIPGVKIPAGIGAAKKGLNWGRRGYGWLLSSPARRKSYDNALKAIKENNKALYIKSAEELQKSFNQESEKD